MKQKLEMISYFLFLSALVFLFQNCAQYKDSDLVVADGGSLETKVTFEWLDENIIQPRCVSCHNDLMASAGLNMMTKDGVMAAVVPGQPDLSTLYTRSFTTTFFVLKPFERESIRVWILNGAVD